MVFVLGCAVMDPEEKKRIANEKRLKAVKEWKKNRTVQKIKLCNSKDEQNAIPLNNGDNKLQLFESDDEDEKYEECFKNRPQFDGPRGQELLEMSSKFTDRFKLDEKFKEDSVSVLPNPVTEDDQEKERNMKILQSVLGYEVSSKPVDQKSIKKRSIRFDPEDERAVKCIKQLENSVEKPKKEKSRKRSDGDGVEPEIPVSTERYIEVSSNLKEILNASSTPFSFSQRFNEEVEEDYFIPVNKKVIPDYKTVEKEKERRDVFGKDEDKKLELSQKSSTRYFAPKMKSESFFIKSGDPRLKEGVEFFKRPKSLEEIREEWQKMKDYVLELFRKKKKTSLRSHSTKVKSMQIKTALRKQNFQYL